MDLQADLPLLLVLLALLLFSVFIAAAEAAFLRVPAVRVQTMAAGGSRRARQLQEMTSRMSTVLNAILLAALLSQIAAATVAGILAIRWFDERLGPTIASVGLTVIMYIYAEAIPKTYAVRNADRVALVTAIPLAIVERILRPVVSILVWIADLQMPGKGVEGSPTVTEDELRMLATAAATEGEITDEDAALIDRAFRVGDREADDVMVPRTDVVAVPSTMTVDEAVEIAIESGHRRLPVYVENRENMTGVVGLRSMIAVPVERRGMVEVGSLAEELLVVPQSKRVLELLQEMQQTSTHLAIVVDEYGGTAGLVTVEDIVEEVLGSISVTPVSEEISKVDSDTWVIDGTIPVEDLGELMNQELEDDDWNTAAGLIMAELGRVPRLGDQITYEGHSLKVIGLRGRRITRIEVRRL
ncbi:MAG: hemolysin family protein [Acidimicrobiia bacterium]|nr:hemolysin family protein [Acidimicrobiia bacterium]